MRAACHTHRILVYLITLIEMVRSCSLIKEMKSPQVWSRSVRRTSKLILSDFRTWLVL